ncbi:unnamed protein product [Caenorhabditis angaria]|uniref:Uncharacterized protein n=1 Tax=Caenorhabditis angaria TaxID=860376 RepID=A0A9P1IEY2_9PELO|nr:unnamed protein product [Caenorhabditis angaria]
MIESMWTENISQMIVIENSGKIQSLLIGGFIDWHYMISLVFGITNCYNNRVLREFPRSDSYTLCSRFQAKENLRIMNLVFRVLIIGLILIFIDLALLMIMVFGLLPDYAIPINTFIEFIIHLNPLLICPMLIYSVDQWFDFYLGFLIKKSEIAKRKRKNTKIENYDNEKERDLYFRQLEMSWM